jgi:hypothetical protein
MGKGAKSPFFLFYTAAQSKKATGHGILLLFLVFLLNIVTTIHNPFYYEIKLLQIHLTECSCVCGTG